MKSYISIHDVAPYNMDNIENIIHILKNQFNINKICILVIPGLDWNNKQIKKIKINNLKVSTYKKIQIIHKKQLIITNNQDNDRYVMLYDAKIIGVDLDEPLLDV